MKKLIATLALSGAVLAGVACTPEEDTPGAPPEQYSSYSPDETAYLAVLKEEGISSPKGQDWLITVGRDVVCATLDDIAEPSTWSLLGISDGIESEFDNSDEAAFAVGASVGAFCPEYSYLIEG